MTAARNWSITELADKARERDNPRLDEYELADIEAELARMVLEREASDIAEKAEVDAWFEGDGHEEAQRFLKGDRCSAGWCDTCGLTHGAILT